jgi:hypothetical protein
MYDEERHDNAYDQPWMILDQKQHGQINLLENLKKDLMNIYLEQK